MFKPGDKVVHTRHGAGTVIERRVRMFEGEEREYFCIKMNDDRYTLMIPVEALDEDEIRPAMTDPELVERVMTSKPQELADDYRARQAEIKKALKSRNPSKLAQALRDLSWLERIHKLTNTDTQIRDQVLKALARELALLPDYNVNQARATIHKIIDSAMETHLKDHPEALVN
jgi:RNA polymerase-interacting CarD/CdnL/TRCF family regulator